MTSFYRRAWGGGPLGNNEHVFFSWSSCEKIQITIPFDVKNPQASPWHPACSGGGGARNVKYKLLPMLSFILMSTFNTDRVARSPLAQLRSAATHFYMLHLSWSFYSLPTYYLHTLTSISSSQTLNVIRLFQFWTSNRSINFSMANSRQKWASGEICRHKNHENNLKKKRYIFYQINVSMDIRLG